MNIAFIPVRGGSKSIPLKNIKLMNGRPLIYWVLDAAVNCNDIDRVYVSTDSELIMETINNYKNDKVFAISRSKESAADTASTEMVMLEFAEKYDFENIVLIQATSPLLSSDDLNNGFKIYKSNKIDSVLSGVRQYRFIWKEENEVFNPVNYDYLNRPRRQEFDGFLVENGAFYITSKENLLKSKCRISGNIGFCEMNEDTYYEIDEPSDWKIIEHLLKNREGKIVTNLNKIKMLLTDSDGVLTDGGMYYDDKDRELKKFNTKDGMGLALLQKKGIITGIITGEKTNIVTRRAEKLRLDIVEIGVEDKLEKVKALCKQYNIGLDNIAYIGDDINDYELISAVGFGCTVYDGIKQLKDVAQYVTIKKGGEGAVREVAEMILNFLK